ncbi:MAG: hypothetical protein PVH41_19240 [Anaerolineae bacterium]|jgi:hypothetical protein
MDIIILTTVLLAGIALESYVAERARRRTRSDDRISDRLSRHGNGDEV